MMKRLPVKLLSPKYLALALLVLLVLPSTAAAGEDCRQVEPLSGLANDHVLTILFNQAIDPASLDSSTVKVVCQSSGEPQEVSIQVTGDGKGALVTPVVNYAWGQAYRLYLEEGIHSLADPSRTLAQRTCMDFTIREEGDPAGPGNGTDPGKPSDPGEPGDPADPGDPTEPRDPVNYEFKMSELGEEGYIIEDFLVAFGGNYILYITWPIVYDYLGLPGDVADRPEEILVTSGDITWKAIVNPYSPDFFLVEIPVYEVDGKECIKEAVLSFNM